MEGQCKDKLTFFVFGHGGQSESTLQGGWEDFHLVILS
jgi:hypothetical protein